MAVNGMRQIILLTLLFFSLLLPRSAGASNGEGAGINERLGEVIPGGLTFLDETGSEARLGEIVETPAVITFAYYGCTNLCPTILGAISEVLSEVRSEPGRDFSVVTVSFDEEDTPADAAKKKRDYVSASGRELPDNAWRFLTGEAGQIRQLTEAAGFHYLGGPGEFAHPAALVVVSKDLRITRYLYGRSYLPFDLEMALTEASTGVSSPAIRKAILFCFSYDPEGKRYVFNALKVTGLVVLASAAGVFVLVTRKGGRSG